MNITDLQKPLSISDIDFRIQSINKGKYATILAYKDARVDINRLNDVCGHLGWKREHSRDNKNCTVSIWDDERKHWVSKEDTGTESNTEHEKGLASDSFKRACFNWGIGIELYDYPLIQIQLHDNEVDMTGPKPKATWKLNLREWVWISDFEDGKLTYLMAKDDRGNTRFEWNRVVKPAHRFKPGEKDEILKQVRDALFNGDEIGLKQILDEYSEPEEKQKVWSLFTSTERSSIKSLLSDNKE